VPALPPSIQSSRRRPEAAEAETFHGVEPVSGEEWVIEGCRTCAGCWVCPYRSWRAARLSRTAVKTEIRCAPVGLRPSGGHVGLYAPEEIANR
jgi:hypothetical protein